VSPSHHISRETAPEQPRVPVGPKVDRTRVHRGGIKGIRSQDGDRYHLVLSGSMLLGSCRADVDFISINCFGVRLRGLQATKTPPLIRIARNRLDARFKVRSSLTAD